MLTFRTDGRSERGEKHAAPAERLSRALRGVGDSGATPRIPSHPALSFLGTHLSWSAGDRDAALAILPRVHRAPDHSLETLRPELGVMSQLPHLPAEVLPTVTPTRPRFFLLSRQLSLGVRPFHF